MRLTTRPSGVLADGDYSSRANALTFAAAEAVPGGPMEPVTRMSYRDGPARFERTLLQLLAWYAPSVRARVDDERLFGPARPIDILQGAITSVVRRAWASVGAGRYAVALGDAWVLNDPIAGQGANLGSRCAFILADAILAASGFDEPFCRRVEALMWEAARPVTEWSNAFLEPPSMHGRELLAAAAADQRVGGGCVVADKGDGGAAGAAHQTHLRRAGAHHGQAVAPAPAGNNGAALGAPVPVVADRDGHVPGRRRGSRAAVALQPDRAGISGPKGVVDHVRHGLYDRRSRRGRSDTGRDGPVDRLRGRRADPRREFTRALTDAGFVDVEIVETHRVHEHAASASVRARKPAPSLA